MISNHKKSFRLSFLVSCVLVFLSLGLLFYLFQKFQFESFITPPLKIAFSIILSVIFSPPLLGIIAQLAPSAVGLDRPPMGPDRWKKFQKGFILGVVLGTPTYLLLSSLGDIYIFSRPIDFNLIYGNLLPSILFSILCSICIIGIGLIIEVYPGDKEANLEGSD